MRAGRQGAPGRPGFSLLELIVVLVALALVASLSAPMVARSVGVGAERRAAGALATALAVVRLGAIQGQGTITASIEASGGRAVVRWPVASAADTEARESVIEPFPLVFVGGERPDGGSSARVAFGPRGRADVERLVLRSGRGGGRLWRIEFDPVGGVPAARRHTEGSQP
ncbi:MAG: prepilin-type N-terminal cleavage/methylation domain-containing protein [Planctomycetota bacterium]|nr:MAG: prepilin-type N-terminal cleavage/methylation domain-containing protein [Planctomycetota bacterium]